MTYDSWKTRSDLDDAPQSEPDCITCNDDPNECRCMDDWVDDLDAGQCFHCGARAYECRCDGGLPS